MTAENLAQYFRCRSCGMKFDSFGGMQGHMLVERMYGIYSSALSITRDSELHRD
jgi:hypothetical protein